MAEQYKTHRDKYVTYFTNIIRNVDVYLQEDQLAHTRQSLLLVTVPTYLPNNYELEQNDAQHIERAVQAETKEAEHEMIVIMSENQNNNSMHSF